MLHKHLLRLPRGPRTLVVGLLLVAVYATFVRLTAPWLNIQRAQQMPVSAPPSAVKSADFSAVSAQWFPEDPWVATAGKRFRDGQRYLFFQEFSLFNNNHSMQVKPVAILWHTDDEEQPITVSAASAQLDRSSAFNMAEAEFGRITSGHLAGDVYIRGPDGLSINGRNFYISENSMMIWSSQPVTFTWESHTGRAEGGVEIQLLSAADTAGGLMSVSDIQSLRLNGRVTCDLVLPDRDRAREPTRLNINAARGFEFSVATRTAMFFGYEDREAIPENQILVQRPNTDGTTDKLVCTQLTLQMRPRANKRAAEQARARQVELHSILAEGSRVVVRLEQHNVTATMTSLRYTIDESLLELWHNKSDANGRPFPVQIRQDGSEVLAPFIMVLHGRHNDVHSLQCRGPGIIRHREQADQEAMEAMWTGSLEYRQQPDPRIRITGNVQVAQAARQLRLAARQIELLLRGTADTEHTTGQPGPASPPGATADGSDQSQLNFARLRPQTLLARENVELTGPQISGEIHDSLTVHFVDPTADSSGVPAQPASRSTAAATDPTAPGDRTSFTHFAAQTMETTILAGEGSRGRLSDVWLKGQVSVDHTAVDPEQSFSATGNVLNARSGFDGGRDLSLFGDPAAIVSTTRRVEGLRIDLSELQREFRVEGSGRIRMVVDRGADGRPLEKPSPLDIYWTEKMHFSGRTAHFLGDIRAVMKDPQTHDLEMKCFGMQIHFSDAARRPQQRSGQPGPVRQVSAGSLPEQEQPAVDVERVECNGLVTVQINQLLNGILEARHVAEFTDLQVHVQSGDFEAVGPGWIESTQPDRGNRLKVSPAVTVRSNAATRASDNPFVYVKASFIGTLSGNVRQQVVRMSQHVAGVFGPVRRLGDRVEINTVTTADLPPQSGVLRCEQLTVSAIPGAQPGERSFSLLAETNARMELKEFSGDADRITYDHSKKQYILRGEQDRMATVSHRPGTGGDVRRLVGQKFEYYPPPRNKLTANQIINLNAGE